MNNINGNSTIRNIFSNVESTRKTADIKADLVRGYSESDTQVPTVTTYHLTGEVTVEEGTEKIGNVQIIDMATQEVTTAELKTIANKITAEGTGDKGNE